MEGVWEFLGRDDVGKNETTARKISLSVRTRFFWVREKSYRVCFRRFQHLFWGRGFGRIRDNYVISFHRFAERQDVKTSMDCRFVRYRGRETMMYVCVFGLNGS